MKELNNFRNFLSEDLDEGMMDKFKKFGKKVKDVADKMDGGPDGGGIFGGLPGGKPTPQNDKVKKEQEGEIHEGTWSLGSAQNMEAAITQLQGMMREDDPAAWMQAFEDLDTILYRVFGDDGFHDALGASKAAVEDGDIDRAKNALGDALGIAQQLLAYQVKQNAENLEENDAVLDEVVDESFIGDLATRIRKRRAAKKEKERFTKGLDMKDFRGKGPVDIEPEFTAGLEENDAVLDEVSESMGIFKEIDMMVGNIKDQMDPDDAFDSLVSEFEAISGGTKLLHKALKNISLDNNLEEGKDDE